MKPTMLSKDDTSGNDGCPSVYVEDGEFVVQGPEATPETLTALSNVLPGETAVRIKIDIVRAALTRYDAGLAHAR